MLLGQIEQVIVLYAALAPQVSRFLITRAILIALKHGEGQLVRVDAQPFGAGQKFPAPGDHLILEIIAQAPVAQHFKESQVAHIAHFVNVAGTDALLHVGQARALRMLLTQQIGNQGMHARGGEEHGGIVFGNDGGGRNDAVALLLEEPQEQRAQLIGRKLFHSDYAPLNNKIVPARSKTNRHNIRGTTSIGDMTRPPQA